MQFSMLALVGVLAFVLGGAALAARTDAPTITSVSPASGARGTTVVVQGTNLQQASVTWTSASQPGAQGSTSGAMKAAPIQATVSPDGTQITISVPDGGDTSNGIMAPGGLNRFTVTTPGGTISRTFKVTSENTIGLKPVITELMPKRAAPGVQITIFGHHFTGATFVKLGGMKAAFRIPSDSRLVVKVPMKAHSGTWTVKTAYGTAMSTTRFTVTGAAT
jgi:hypothetical protein